MQEHTKEDGMNIRDLYTWLIKFRPEHKQIELIFVPKEEKVKPLERRES